MGQHLQPSPVSDEVGLQTQYQLAQSEGNVNTDTRQHGVLGAHVLHYQDKADHEAGHSSHPRDEPQHGEQDETRRSVAMSSSEARNGDEEDAEGQCRDPTVPVRQPPYQVGSDQKTWPTVWLSHHLLLHPTQHVGDVDHGPQVGPVTDQLEVLHQGGEDHGSVVEEIIILTVRSPASDVTAVLGEERGPASGLSINHVITRPTWHSSTLTRTGRTSYNGLYWYWGIDIDVDTDIERVDL